MATQITRRQLLMKATSLAGLTAVGAMLNACATPTPQVIKETVVVKETVPVEKTVEKVVTPTPKPRGKVDLTFWDGGGAATRVKYLQDTVIPLWQEKHPGVTMTLEVVSDLHTRAVTALAAGEGPDLLNGHSFFRYDIQRAKICRPYPKDLFPMSWREKLYSWPYLNVDGEQYTCSFGNMSAVIHYRADIWEKAGLTEKDFPKTWDELRLIAKELTVRDSKTGEILQAGIVFDAPFVTLWDMVKQRETMYYEIGEGDVYTQCLLMQDAFVEGVEWHRKLYVEDKSCSFSLPWGGTMIAEGKAAMAYYWTWILGLFEQTAPDAVPYIKQFRLPSWTGEQCPCKGVFNFEEGLMVPKVMKEGHDELIWDFIHFTICEDDERTAQLATLSLVTPDRKDLVGHKSQEKYPGLKFVAEDAPYKVHLGELVTAHFPMINDAVQSVVDAGTPVKEALANAKKLIDEDLAKNKVRRFPSENRYQKPKECA